jgi:Tol biopolymer transport system component/DNA-binding winged helix-turn-helix (wHTH) protein
MTPARGCYHRCSIKPPLQEPFRIGGAYHVEPSLNRVTGPNGVTRLEPKVMLVLVCLAEHAGQMVSKHRLFSAVWPDIAVSDDVLTRAISELRRLFDDDPKQPRVIETIPRAGYRLIAPITPPPADAAGGTASPSRQTATAENGPSVVLRRGRGRLRIAVPAAALILAIVAVTWWPSLRRRGETPPMQVVPLTVLPGLERWPTFSPDGDQVAFEWDGENGDNADIYITMVGSSELRRLTTNPAGDHAPSWSPDGRQIAYVRDTAESGGRIHLVSPLGGSDRTVSDVPVLARVAWSPDGRYLAAQRVAKPGGICLIPLDGGEPRQVIESKPPRADSAPAFSPDGRRLAYRSCATPIYGCDVYVLDVDRALVPMSSPRRITPSTVPLIGSLAWTRDGRSVIYNSFSPLITYLWRVEADGTRPPERVEAAGLGAAMPAVALSRDRLAFVRIVVDTDVYRFQPGRPIAPALVSSFLEAETRFSPDGRRLAFASMRSTDTFRIWTAASDGSGAQQATFGPGFQQGSPWWSPDGRRIAFDAFTDDWHTHIWTMDIDAGTPQPLTTDPGDQNVPYWSRDGRWIYFSADRGTGRDIWRVPAAGGLSHPVTRGGSGKFACESPDGQSLLYQPSDADSPLLALPINGGAARPLVECVKPSAFAAGPDGVYYVACDPGPDPALHVMDPATGRDRLLGRLEKYEYLFGPVGLAVSPDGNSVLYPRRIRDSFDLMVIENFR